MDYRNGINKVVLVGHICNETAMEAQPGSVEYLRFRFVTQERIAKKAGNEDHAEYHIISVPAGMLRSGTRYLSKDKLICLEGKLKTKSDTDSDGIKRYQTEILVSKLYSVG
ncbi:single-strand DNA-binding protein [Mucilaginibacter pineti]|uniref:Single-strand DNA-binding protein n=1 Tax=Mucilaginibacter pineti TaxID=1391627 RepID=A0A1G7H6C9_9SPHI|nr:single-stranded DNA-binding protein [Mucilaginibacter pineti]SDE95925.1 single-strand DNA-binding protein [Mucilaginibacter pineti]